MAGIRDRSPDSEELRPQPKEETGSRVADPESRVPGGNPDAKDATCSCGDCICRTWNARGVCPGAAAAGRRWPSGGAPAGPASFFITSVGKGDGANYGGIAGADAYCAQMAQGGGLATPPGRTWRAYLSQPASGGQPAVNARDRIGAGPWYNARGQLIANNVADLHGDVQRDRNSINKTFALTEKSTVVNGVGDMPNQHDILTGSDSTGRAVAGDMDTTCTNYTSNGDGKGSVMLGHLTARAAATRRGTPRTDRVAAASRIWWLRAGRDCWYCFAAN